MPGPGPGPGPGSACEDQMKEIKVYAKCHLQKGVMFGPFVGEVGKGQMPTNLKYAWAVSKRFVRCNPIYNALIWNL